MYTQCTECRTVYQVGPEDLKRAHGRVRCGACGTVFDALETLSHEPPPPQSAEPTTPEPESIEESAPEIGPEPEPQPETAPEPEQESEREPQRFDDDTPLEEILASFGGELSAETGEEEGEQRREAPAAEPQTDSLAPGEPAEVTPDTGDDVGESEDLGDEDEWRALLAELELDETTLGVGLQRETGAEDAGPVAQPPEAEAPLEELTLAGDEPAETQPDAVETTGTGTAAPEAGERSAGEAEPAVVPESPEPVPTSAEEPSAPEVPREPEEPATARDSTLAVDEEGERPARAEERDDLAASAALFDEIVQSGEFAAILSPDADAAAAAAAEARGRQDREEPQPAAEATRSVKSETAEGAAVEQPEADGDEDIIDQTLLPRRRGRSRTLLWSAAALLLVAALGAQVIHGQRAQLATHPEFGPRLQQFYGLFGADVQPRWDIGALCVESSSGDASADSLQITSVIVHQGNRPQPYPLLQVSLTDRWQSVIGSRSVEADDYLPEGELRDVRLHPGDRVRARARLSDPGSEAAGYELHVCYRGAEGDLRCSGACR